MASNDSTQSNQNGFCMIIPENIGQSELQFLSHKCKSAIPILKENWDVLLPKCRDFLTLIDREKVAFDIGVKELNSILISGFFTTEEVKAIKKFRYQVKNNFAARKMRDNYRKIGENIEFEIEILMKEKGALISEMENLSSEISFYQKEMAN
ncbi:hypothetical protein LOD99_13661 [Oopsacas minuta]|uniref:Uncharacterized protein n=1 Tax=Oopsacas minuta TaxID=111878 RepID=A0AAV7KHV7_9METZ|nr:hypothetical protein LOD99_13661 [Oopsacas minuta]